MPPSACSNFPLRLAMAPVKRPFSWPKSSHSISSSGMAAQFTSTKGCAARRLCVVDGARHQFLARAVLARDEHPGIGGCHPVDGVADVQHRFAVADHVVARRMGAPQLGVLLLQPALLDAVADDRQQALLFPGFLQEVVGPQPAALHRGLLVAVGGDDDHVRAGRFLADALQDLEPVHARHLDVEQDDVRLFLGQEFEGPESILGQPGLETVILEQALQGDADALLVVDDQDALGHRARLLGVGGPWGGPPRSPS